MTVAQFIEKLKTLPQNAQVWVASTEDEYYGPVEADVGRFDQRSNSVIVANKKWLESLI